MDAIRSWLWQGCLVALATSVGREKGGRGGWPFLQPVQPQGCRVLPGDMWRDADRRRRVATGGGW